MQKGQKAAYKGGGGRKAESIKPFRVTQLRSTWIAMDSASDACQACHGHVGSYLLYSFQNNC